MTWVKILEKQYTKPPTGVVLAQITIVVKTVRTLDVDEVEKLVEETYSRFVKDPVKWFLEACKKGLVPEEYREFCRKPPSPDEFRWVLHKVIVYHTVKGGEDFYKIVYILYKPLTYTYVPVRIIILLIAFALSFVISLWLVKEIVSISAKIIQYIPPEAITAGAIATVVIGAAGLALVLYGLLKR